MGPAKFVGTSSSHGMGHLFPNQLLITEQQATSDFASDATRSDANMKTALRVVFDNWYWSIGGDSESQSPISPHSVFCFKLSSSKYKIFGIHSKILHLSSIQKFCFNSSDKVSLSFFRIDQYLGIYICILHREVFGLKGCIIFSD